MKSFKAAAVVAGSLAVTGVCAPAFALDTAPTSVGGALQTVTSQKSLGVNPLSHRSDGLDTENRHSPLSAVKTATNDLNGPKGPARLLGGLPLKGH
ncbi:hypothetical protein AB0C59_13850 [Streptomyces sp. NPDC048664]|uniref:hypothetical protein n=1 Tax=Streptomyces sp. NPDC048664 TaxID=3154505 RepID=UPI00343000F0